MQINLNVFLRRRYLSILVVLKIIISQVLFRDIFPISHYPMYTKIYRSDYNFSYICNNGKIWNNQPLAYIGLKNFIFLAEKHKTNSEITKVIYQSIRVKKSDDFRLIRKNINFSNYKENLLNGNEFVKNCKTN